jgi:hypothetical protein
LPYENYFKLYARVNLPTGFAARAPVGWWVLFYKKIVAKISFYYTNN